MGCSSGMPLPRLARFDRVLAGRCGPCGQGVAKGAKEASIRPSIGSSIVSLHSMLYGLQQRHAAAAAVGQV